MPFEGIIHETAAAEDHPPSLKLRRASAITEVPYTTAQGLTYLIAELDAHNLFVVGVVDVDTSVNIPSLSRLFLSLGLAESLFRETGCD